MDEASSSPFKLPRGGVLSIVWWCYSWPIRFILACVCPNPRTNRRFYVVTFFVCIAFLGLNAYFIVWMLTIFGKSELSLISKLLKKLPSLIIGLTVGIPTVVLGLTILAAGAGSPEAFSCAISIRNGNFYPIQCIYFIISLILSELFFSLGERFVL